MEEGDVRLEEDRVLVEDAVAAEQYERAAELRDGLRDLDLELQGPRSQDPARTEDT